jgi:hypothetical protein
MRHKMGGACGKEEYIYIYIYIQGFIVCGNLNQRDNLEDLNVDGKTILILTLKKSDGGHKLDFFWFSIGRGGRLL